MEQVRCDMEQVKSLRKQSADGVAVEELVFVGFTCGIKTSFTFPLFAFFFLLSSSCIPKHPVPVRHRPRLPHRSPTKKGEMEQARCEMEQVHP